MKKIYDISLTITENMATWPGDIKPKFQKASSLDKGDIANVTHVHMSAHTGTHIDAPQHFLKDAKTVEFLPLEVLIGKALVVELSDIDTISAKDLKKAKIPKGITRVLFKTKNSKLWKDEFFHSDYVALAEDGARYLVDLGIQLIGIDYLSIGPFEHIVPTHLTLLKKEVIIVEGLNLSEVPPGNYTLYCLPIKLAHADGAPARAVLFS